MARFEIPDAGVVEIFRNGWDPLDDMPERHRHVLWRYTVTGADGQVLAKGNDLSTPQEADADRATVALIGLLCVEEWQDPDTEELPEHLAAWGAWDFESSDNEQGYPDSMNWFRTHGVTHWRTEPYSRSGDWGDHWSTLAAVKREAARRWESGEIGAGTVRLYPNDAEVPTHRLTVSARGAVRVVKLG